jgi:nicotinate-nucleotide adenylyltransferase
MLQAPAAPGAVERVGVFGGAFDPPHRAHRALAEAALTSLQLDRLHILPTGQAWHKSRTLSDAAHRLAMCRLAFGGLPSVWVDDREIRRGSASYTVDTLGELQHECPGAWLFLMIGEDQLAAFKSWRRWQEVLSMATLVVAARTDGQGVTHLNLNTPADVPFQRLNIPLSPVSSTTIRSLAATGAQGLESLAALVPGAVARYISLHSLYQQPS